MRPEFLVFAVASLATGATADPVFERRSQGISHTYAGGWEHFIGGGVAVFDCNNDRMPDLFVAGGAEPARMFINSTGEIGAELAFTAHPLPDQELGGVTGAYPLDIDGDGLLDLAVLRVGANKLLKGGPDCSFSEFTNLGFQSGDRWTTAFSATWEQGQELPTLAFGNYVDRRDPNGPFEVCDDNMLYRPADGLYADGQPLTPGYCTLSVLFSDWGRRGRADLRVSNDRHYYVREGQEQMWAMESQPRLYTKEDGWREFKLWGMGIASRDLSGDGLPEIYLTSMGDQKLQSLEVSAAGPSYKDATYERGTTAHRPYLGDDGRPSTGWHVAFGDVTNDGRDDIFVAKGNVEQMPSSAMKDPNNLLIQQADGRFVEAGDSAGVATMERSRGGALVDMNMDGLLDLVVVNRRAPLEIYQNISQPEGHWLAVGLEQSGHNRNAVGAWIELDTGDAVIAREITVGGGHASGTLVPEHFGLGDVDTVRLRVIWPDGAASDWEQSGVDRAVLVGRDGDAIVVSDY
ncbi:CRTAC1 family protein [Qingshengfaniella alkalisoli]|uniref:CRTAC1 family protein n=1 Tax=Qingshengfaniella alkalisoli TaxID=2599296 RepID=A0A5B8IAD1_9RHOB|nr:CRTAC1 family protein [Qingshengfaniella alkalisoli]QDY70206.1 CRTAC1 family protein [Qingshengfaniella alkalisoli]